MVRAPGDRWSFARTDASGRVVEVAEKRRISELASTGLYYFSHADELVATAREMFANGETTRGEYYVMPVYQKYIARGWAGRRLGGRRNARHGDARRAAGFFGPRGRPGDRGIVRRVECGAASGRVQQALYKWRDRK